MKKKTKPLTWFVVLAPNGQNGYPRSSVLEAWRCFFAHDTKPQVKKAVLVAATSRTAAYEATWETPTGRSCNGKTDYWTAVVDPQYMELP